MIPSLITAASFTPNSIQPPSAWVGHLPFASWVIREVSPKIFVELGTHSGNSYFSFCQSVVEGGISTKAYAIDTWQGDEHAGQYNDDVFTSVNAYNAEHYGAFSRLLRMTFDDAVCYFLDDSIDLLHIDGLHTYEAVRHDFEKWLPKLASGAVVIFHDTNVRERNFGVWKLWAELQMIYPNNLEFVHSHGLGVLQLNNAAEDKKLKWLDRNLPEKQLMQNYFAAIGSRYIEHFELKQHADRLSRASAERDGNINLLNQSVADRDHKIADFSQVIADRDAQLHHLHQVVAKYDQKLSDFTQAVTDRDSQIASLNQALAERDGIIADLKLALSERNQEYEFYIAERNKLIDAICSTAKIG